MLRTTDNPVQQPAVNTRQKTAAGKNFLEFVTSLPTRKLDHDNFSRYGTKIT